MKRTIAVILLVAGISFTLMAQFQSIFGNTETSWNVVIEDYWELNYLTDSISAGEDTIINSLTYTKVNYYLFDDNPGLIPTFDKTAFIRENLSEGKAWILCEDYSGVLQEFLFMNLSLSINDTFVINGGIYPVDSIYYDNGRKHVRIAYEYPMLLDHYPSYTGRLTFIEGIGTSFGFTYKTSSIGWFPINHAQPYLLCSWKDGNQLYYHNNPNPFFAGCHIFDTIVGIKPYDSSQGLSFSLYPNPANDRLMVELKNVLQPVSFAVYSITGIKQELFVITEDRKLYFDVSGLPNGIYILGINNLFSKFVIRR